MLAWLRKILGIRPPAPRRVLEIKHGRDFARVLITGAVGMHLQAEPPGGHGAMLVAKHQAVDPEHFDELWRHYNRRVLKRAVWESDGKRFRG